MRRWVLVHSGVTRLLYKEPATGDCRWRFLQLSKKLVGWGQQAGPKSDLNLHRRIDWTLPISSRRSRKHPRRCGTGPGASSFCCYILPLLSPWIPISSHSLLLPCLLRTPRFLQASPRPREGAPLYRSEDSWSCCRGFKVSYDFFFFIFFLTKKNWIFGALCTFFLCFSSVWFHYVLLFPSGSRDGFVLPSRCCGFRCHSLVVCCNLCLPYWFMEILCPTAALMRILGHAVVEACLCDECWKFSLVSPAFCSISVRKRSWIICPNVAVEGWCGSEFGVSDK